MKIKIGSKNFIAILDDNATAAAFKALLPMTVEMTELNGNEKYARLSGNLPTNACEPRNDPDRRFDDLWLEDRWCFSTKPFRRHTNTRGSGE